MFTVKLFKDGDQWCALIGPDPQAGVAGFGDTEAEAIRDLAFELDTRGTDGLADGGE